jgi:hypothetical protein
MSFTTQAAIEMILSEDSSDDYVSDLTGADLTAMWTSILQETDSTIYMYLNDLYDPATLSGNYWLQEKGKWIGAYLLTKRRGNPAYFVAMYDEVLEMLQAIRDGKLKLPANDGSMLAMSSANAPAMLNVIMDDRSKLMPVRIDTINSSGDTAGTSFIPYWERFWSW